MCQANAVCYTWTEYVFNQFPTEINHIADNAYVRETLARLHCHLRVERDFHALGSQIRVLVAAPDSKTLAECNRTLERIVPEYCTRKRYRVTSPSKICEKYRLLIKSDSSGDDSLGTTTSANYWTGSCGERKKLIRFTAAKPVVKRLRWALVHNIRKPCPNPNESGRVRSRWDTRRLTTCSRTSRWPSFPTPTARSGEWRKGDLDCKANTQLTPIGRSLAWIKATHKSPFHLGSITRGPESRNESVTTLADITNTSLKGEQHTWMRIRESVAKQAMGDGTNSNMNVFQGTTAQNLSDHRSTSYSCWLSDRKKDSTLKDSPGLRSGLGDSRDPRCLYESVLKRTDNTGRNTSKDMTAFTSEECDSNQSSWELEKEKGNFFDSGELIRSHCSSSDKKFDNSMKVKQYLTQFIGDRSQSVTSHVTRRTQSSLGSSHCCTEKSDHFQMNRPKSRSVSQKPSPHQMLPKNLSVTSPSSMRATKSACTVRDEASPHRKQQTQNQPFFFKPPRRFIRMNEMKRGNLTEYSTGRTLAGACASHDVATQFVVTRMNSAQMDTICQTHDGVILQPDEPNLIEPHCQEAQSLCQLSPGSRNDHPVDHIHPATVEVRPHICQVSKPDALNVEIGPVPTTISSRTVPAYCARSCGVQVDWPGPTERYVPTVCHCCHHGPRRDRFVQALSSTDAMQSQATNSFAYVSSEGFETGRKPSVRQKLENLEVNKMYKKTQNEVETTNINQTQITDTNASIQLNVVQLGTNSKQKSSNLSHVNKSGSRPKSDPCDRTTQSAKLDGTGYADLKTGGRYCPRPLGRVFVLASGENKGHEDDGTAIILTGNSSETEPIQSPFVVNSQSPSRSLNESEGRIPNGECSSCPQPSSWSNDSSPLRICTVGRRVTLYRPVCMSKALHRANRVFNADGVVMGITKTATKLKKPKPEPREISPPQVKAKSIPLEEVHNSLWFSQSDQKLIPFTGTDRSTLQNSYGKLVAGNEQKDKLITASSAQEQVVNHLRRLSRCEPATVTKNQTRNVGPQTKPTSRTSRQEILPRLRIGCRAPQYVGRSTAPIGSSQPVTKRPATVSSICRSGSMTSVGESESPRIRRRSLSRSDGIQTSRIFTAWYTVLPRSESGSAQPNRAPAFVLQESGARNTEKGIFPWNQSPSPNSHRRSKPVFGKSQAVSKKSVSTQSKNTTNGNGHCEQTEVMSKNHAEIRTLIDTYLSSARKRPTHVPQSKDITCTEIGSGSEQMGSSGPIQQHRRKSSSLPGTSDQGNQKHEPPTKRTDSREEHRLDSHETPEKTRVHHLLFSREKLPNNEQPKISPSPLQLTTRSNQESLSPLYPCAPLEDHSLASTTGFSSGHYQGDRCTTEEVMSSEIHAFDERLGMALRGTLDRILWESADQSLWKREPLSKEQIRRTYLNLSPFAESGTCDGPLSEINGPNFRNKEECMRPFLERPESTDMVLKSDQTKLISQNSQAEKSSSLWCCAVWRRTQRSCSQ
ncbi:hypothetical protein D915_006975 [Fasciola hepatica]|uniref:Uncharacterized protein n=1 Tax=Fasciola hepatica TaxID=6192 RepID=A0A2H1C5D0_FASHE|nr:hypothetical protein D915_006975 [Fasciola hepatica]